MSNKTKIDTESNFNNWFDSKYYHILYKDRDHDEARKFITKLLEHLNLKKSMTILDAACGKGRHSIEIEKLGYKVTGIDLSKNSIKHAKQFENLNLKFKIHDISIPLGIKFNVVFNLFTSFGYYNRENDLKTLLSIEENLKDDGVGVIDFFNIHNVKKNLIEQENIIRDNINFNISRKTKDKLVEKNISFEDNSIKYSYKETVNGLNLNDFKNYFKKTNLEINEIFGDYELNKFDLNYSPRLIIVFKKKSQSN